jgi:cell division protease FtsH
VRTLIDTCYTEAKSILDENTDKLHSMADALIKYETIDEDQIKDIMEGREPSQPEHWDDSDPGAPAEPESETAEQKPTPPLGGPAGQH